MTAARRRAAGTGLLILGLAAYACADRPPSPDPGAGRALVWHDRSGAEVETVALPPAAWRDIWLDADETVALALTDDSDRLWRIDLSTGDVTAVDPPPVADVPTGTRLVHIGPAHAVLAAIDSRSADPPALFVQPRQAAEGARAFPGADVPAVDGRLSPDERWLAYVSRESGVDEVYITTFPDADARWLVSLPDGGRRPVWRSDSQEIYYWAPGGRLMRAALRRGDRFVLPEMAAPVFNRPDLADAPFAVRRDTTRLLLAVTR